MKFTSFIVFSLALTLCVGASAQVEVSTSTEWWTYIADYEGTPGSTRVDMGLLERAPMRALSHVVIAGTKYQTSHASGLPDQAELDHLNDMSDKVIAAILTLGPSIYVGTFTHNREQVHYVYVKDLAGAEAAFLKALAAACKSCEPTYRTKLDPEWRTYLKFLYPNRETMEFYHFDPKQARSYRK